MVLVRCPELRRPLRLAGHEVTAVTSLARLLRPNHGLDGRVAVIRLEAFEDDDIAEVMGDLRQAFPLVDLVLWAPGAPSALVREALLAGARDVLLTDSAEVGARVIGKILETQPLMSRATDLGYEEDRDSVFHGMLARSRRMWDLFDTVERIARTEAPVLVLGETGTGKELLARAVHRLSGRPGRFVPVNCAAIAENLVDSELFGHLKGAFTGAVRENDGLFRHADTGTLLLDEIGHISLSAQHRLLRALQEGAVRPVGAHTEVPVDVRIVAATSTSLEEDVQKGRFREDLFYRLDVIRLEIPPLRERPEDIIFLFGHFARELARQYDLRRPDVTDGFLDELLDYAWPGNVRQLENFTERLLLTHSGGALEPGDVHRHLPFEEGGGPAAAEAAAVRTPRGGRRVVSLDDEGAGTDEPGAMPVVIDTGVTLEEAVGPHVAALERAYLDACLAAERGRVAATADRAGISRRTLLRKMNQYGLDKADYKSDE